VNARPAREAATRPRDGAEVTEALSRLGPLPSAAASLVPASSGASKALTAMEQKSVAVLLLGAVREVNPALDETLRVEGGNARAARRARARGRHAHAARKGHPMRGPGA
jgi:hypothetical protein